MVTVVGSTVVGSTVVGSTVSSAAVGFALAYLLAQGSVTGIPMGTTGIPMAIPMAILTGIRIGIPTGKASMSSATVKPQIVRVSTTG